MDTEEEGSSIDDRMALNALDIGEGEGKTSVSERKNPETPKYLDETAATLETFGKANGGELLSKEQELELGGKIRDAYRARQELADLLECMTTTDEHAKEYESSLSRTIQRLRTEEAQRLTRAHSDEALAALRSAEEASPYTAYNWLRDVLPSGSRGLYLLEKIFEGDQARDLLIRANICMAAARAKKYTNRGLSYADLMMEGALGTIRAADGYDPENNAKFSTYNWNAIRNAVTAALGAERQIPRHAMKQLMEWQKKKTAMTQKNGYEVSDAELMDTLGITNKKVRTILQKTLSGVEHSVPHAFSQMGDEDFRPEETFTVDEIGRIDDREERDALEPLLQKLGREDKRSELVIRHRYGLAPDGIPKTQEEVSKIIQLSRGHLQRIEARAISWLHEQMTMPECEAEVSSSSLHN